MALVNKLVTPSVINVSTLKISAFEKSRFPFGTLCQNLSQVVSIVEVSTHAWVG